MGEVIEGLLEGKDSAWSAAVRPQTQHSPPVAFRRNSRRTKPRHEGLSRQLHGDYDAIAIEGNGCMRCCDREPTLRIRPESASCRGVPYVEYECRKCGKTGGISLFEDTARAYWNEVCGV